jgi:hypothetical protein
VTGGSRSAASKWSGLPHDLGTKKTLNRFFQVSAIFG